MRRVSDWDCTVQKKGGGEGGRGRRKEKDRRNEGRIRFRTHEREDGGERFDLI